jgi:hypothetical protein
MVALLLPTLAAAQQNEEHRGNGPPPHPGPGGPPHPGGPPPGALAPHPGGPPPGAMAPHPGGPPPGGFAGPPHGPPPGLPPGAMGGPPHGPPPGFAPGAAGGPRPGGPGGAQFSFHGRALNGMHAEPYAYPPGFGYRRWDVGAALPPFFLVPAYFFADWATLGLEPPPPGTQWVRYGPDLLLVDVSNGQVIDVAYGVFY